MGDMENVDKSTTIYLQVCWLLIFIHSKRLISVTGYSLSRGSRVALRYNQLKWKYISKIVTKKSIYHAILNLFFP